ncbi:hypothetical protein [Fictibacillus halophilus]|uniref:hypothetical protein n=1 Tax=Fictibacillus halophilus TaxID=1610490 RepID=UPI001CFB8E14|nr:hypothetical protein [Fictibacillus halophilus]
MKDFDKGKIVLISSEPTGSISRYTNEQMKKIQKSSETVLKRIEDIKAWKSEQ